MVLFVIAASYDLCTTLRAVFERMGFVHIEPVYAKLLEGDDIILAAGVLQFLELHFEALFLSSPGS